MSGIADLPRTLADLYGTDPRGRWMLQRAGLTNAADERPPNALALWTQVTLTAMLRGRLGALLASALKDFPDQPVLTEAVAELRARHSARRRKRLAWFFGLGILFGGALGLLTILPRAGQLRGRVTGLDPATSLDATVTLEGCLRPEPLSPQGSFTLACPSLDADVPALLRLDAAGLTFEDRWSRGEPLWLAVPPTQAHLGPPHLR